MVRHLRGGGGDKWRLGGRASWERLGRFSALLPRARPLRVLPLRLRLEIRPNLFQQMPFPFNQWFHRAPTLKTTWRWDGQAPAKPG